MIPAARSPQPAARSPQPAARRPQAWLRAKGAPWLCLLALLFSLPEASGLNIYPSAVGVYPINSPNLTSADGCINIYMSGAYPQASTHITSVISDYAGRPVGVKITDLYPHRTKDGRGVVWFQGSQSNTFTGTVEVSHDNILALSKDRGALAIQKNILAYHGGAICIDQKKQIANSSTVTMDGRSKSVEFYFNAADTSLWESFHQFVAKGEVNLRFFVSPPTLNVQRTLYLDDLMIESGGTLHVNGWSKDKALLLVRKDSVNLQESLARISFTGYDPNAIHLENHNSDYWEINPLPEPATYGAILGAAGLGLVIYRKKRRSSKRKDAAQ